MDIPVGGISDEELTALALATTTADRPAPEAQADERLLRRGDLPTSYMPAAMPGPQRRWRRPVVIVLVAAFVFIEVMGYCTTYGRTTFG